MMPACIRLQNQLASVGILSLFGGCVRLGLNLLKCLGRGAPAYCRIAMTYSTLYIRNTMTKGVTIG